MALRVSQYGDPVLKKVSENVLIFDKAYFEAKFTEKHRHIRASDRKTLCLLKEHVLK